MADKKKLSYQVNAAFTAVEHLRKNQIFKLSSPTGSGKTMIIGQIIESLITDPSFAMKKKTFIFVAPSTGSLDHQGYEKITGYLNKGWVNGFSTEYIGMSGGKAKKGQYLQNIDKFVENKMYFIGWSLFGKGSNLSKLDSEKNNIQRVIQNTKEANTEIILIIDEAHREVLNKSDNKEAILNEMNPYRTIEVSATLDDPDYKITTQMVRDEKAIKKSVYVDMGIPSEGEVDMPGEVNDIISAALKKQSEVREAYKNRKVNGNPLILIQIPDKSNNKIKSIGKRIDEHYLHAVKKSLDNHGFVEGLNYAIWLSEDKTTRDKDELTNMDSQYDVLVFKQAIATGWDIPRANILVRLREPKSPKFDIQTLGRILRNPRFKYFDNKLIDNAFVFTRDNKYFEKIKKEDFVETAARINIPLSEYGKNSNLVINKVFYEKPIIEEEVIKELTNELKTHKDTFVTIFRKIKEYTHKPVPPFDFSAASVYEGRAIEEINKKKNKDEGKLKFDFTIDDDSLFEIYIKYVSSFSNKNIDFEAFEAFVEWFVQEAEFTKKEIYKRVASTGAMQHMDELGKKNVFEFIEDKKNTIIKEMSSVSKEAYTLHHEFKYNEEHINNKEWDKANSYDASFIKWDSNVEKDFYRDMKTFIQGINRMPTNKEKVHIFRNGVNDESFYIEYYDSFDKLLKFYPDFLIINDVKEEVYILDTKGRSVTGQNIDQNSRLKFNQAHKVKDMIEGGYKVEIFKVEPNKDIDSFTFIGEDDKSSSWETFTSRFYPGL